MKNNQLWIARNEDGKLHLFNEMPVRHDIVWESDNGVSIELDTDIWPELTWEYDPWPVFIGNDDIFESVDDMSKFVDDHISQKTKLELAYLNSLSKNELYWQAFNEGICNGLLLAGYDVTALAGMEEMQPEQYN